MDFNKMNNPQLVEWYNSACQQTEGFRPITRFASRDKGIARCQAVAAKRPEPQEPKKEAKRISIIETGNPCAAGSKRYELYEVAKGCATVAEFKAAGGAKSELNLFVVRGWIKLED